MTEQENKTSSIQWRLTGTVECPYCDHDNDFTAVDDYLELCEPLKNDNDLDIDMTCEKCKKDFKVTESEY